MIITQETSSSSPGPSLEGLGQPADLLEQLGDRVRNDMNLLDPGSGGDLAEPAVIADIVQRLKSAEAQIRASKAEKEAYQQAAEEEMDGLRESLEEARTAIRKLSKETPGPRDRDRADKKASRRHESPGDDSVQTAPTAQGSAASVPSQPAPTTTQGREQDQNGNTNVEDEDDEDIIDEADDRSDGNVHTTAVHGDGYPYTSSKMGGPVRIVPYDVEAHSKEPTTAEAKRRLKAVKDAMKHAWRGYKQHAWGKDELTPVSKGSHNDYGLGLTIIDALDTLYIMGMKEEFKDGCDWVKANLNFSKKVDNRNISVFETMIRVVGGLLSAYDLSGDAKLLNTVVELVNKMMPAFNTKTGLPLSLINLRTGKASSYGWTQQASVLSEVGSVQMELRALSRYTGDDSFATAGDRAFFGARDTPRRPLPGLYPIYLANKELRFTSNQISVGAMGDSFYEYMLKTYLLTGKTDPRYLDMYKESAEGIMNHVIKRTAGWTHTTELSGRKANNVMEHLCCFFGGLFALGYSELQDELHQPRKHLKTAEELTETCFQSYNTTATGIGPEAMVFRKKGMVPEARRQYQLRPETVESLFVLWRVTGDKKYQDKGWQIFQSLEKYTRIETGGYSGLKDVTKVPPEYNNKMDSFFLAETLKYLYLLFAPNDLISLKEFTFNTEAHPFRNWNPTKPTSR